MSKNLGNAPTSSYQVEEVALGRRMKVTKMEQHVAAAQRRRSSIVVIPIDGMNSCTMYAPTEKPSTPENSMRKPGYLYTGIAEVAAAKPANAAIINNHDDQATFAAYIPR